jgi:predicted nucleic acid-binding protein
MPNGKMSYFVDTNLLVYAIDQTEPEKRQYTKDFLTRIINHHTLVLSPQSLNECYRVLTERRGLVPRNEARLLIWGWSEFCTAPYDFAVTQQAWEIQDSRGFGWWDCMLLASASLAGCDAFLTEDMQHEQKIDEMIILDPFRLDPHFAVSR